MGLGNWKKHLTPGQRKAYAVGAVVSLIGGGVLLAPGYETWHMKGPANTGHEAMECDACHESASGDIVSQAALNVMRAVGLTEQDAEFVFVKVSARHCLECHDNPEDRHPIADFAEDEKFAAARAALGVQSCINCHHQHTGVRTTVTPLACQYCHEDTEVEEDPIDVPHAELFADKRWETCLGCHDFHGNHEWETPLLMAEALSPEVIQRYLDGGESPYGYRKLLVMDTMKMESDREEP